MRKKKVTKSEPIIKNENFILSPDEKIVIKHNLPGTQVRYTLDGTSPDSVNGTVYSQPIDISTHTTIKTVATKNEWYKSSETEHQFFKKGLAHFEVKLISVPHKDYRTNGATLLTDGLTGDANNFREGTWLGFKENRFEADLRFDRAMAIKEVAILYNNNIGSYIMPPKEVELWGGAHVDRLKLLKKIRPEQPTKYGPNKVAAIIASVDCTCHIIRIIAVPVGKLPTWHSGKGEKGWVMVSEVIVR